MDLSKTIKINNSHEISCGMLLLTAIITLFEILGMMAFNNWVFPPEAFFLIANAFFTIRKQSEHSVKMDELEKKVEELEKKIDN